MLTVKAYAKVNWSLAVTGRRADGYHLLDMIMQTVGLYDVLTFKPSSGLSLEVLGDAPTESPGDNLVFKAARLLQQETGCTQGARITLEKNIPPGAGLGGGSADAAATLRGLCTLWKITLSPETLSSLALRLGADVPFLLKGGMARVRGIGEHLLPLTPAPAFPIVIVRPAQPLSTPHVFARYDALAPKPQNPDIEALAAALCAQDLSATARCISNALEPAAVSLCADIAHATEMLKRLGAARAWMTGSGSAVVAVFADEVSARQAYLAAKVSWPFCFYTHTLGISPSL